MAVGISFPESVTSDLERTRGFTVSVVPDPRSDSALGIDALYRAHRSAVYRFLLRELGDPHEAEDATQTVFLSAVRSLARGCVPRSPRPWLFAIARNAARRAWTERSRTVRAEVDPDTLPGRSTSDALRGDLVQALAALPETQRQALVLHELGGLEYREIAEATKQSVAGVETAIFRARRACKAQLLADGALDHVEAAKLLPRLVAGKLTRAERESVQLHVGRCDVCAEEERSLRAARPRRARRLVGWLLSLPDGLQRLVGLLQTPSPRALAVLAAAGSALLGSGGASGPAPAPVPSRDRPPQLPGHVVVSRPVPRATGQAAHAPVPAPHAPGAARVSRVRPHTAPHQSRVARPRHGAHRLVDRATRPAPSSVEPSGSTASARMKRTTPLPAPPRPATEPSARPVGDGGVASVVPQTAAGLVRAVDDARTGVAQLVEPVVEPVGAVVREPPAVSTSPAVPPLPVVPPLPEGPATDVASTAATPSTVTGLLP